MEKKIKVYQKLRHTFISETKKIIENQATVCAFIHDIYRSNKDNTDTKFESFVKDSHMTKHTIWI